MDTLLATSVVVCDDDAVLRTVVGQLLAESGYTVAGQADAVEPALYEIEQADADLVILDLALRAGDGEELLALLGERHPDVKVVVFSAFVDDPDRLLELGATAVVDKPDFVRLEEVVRGLRSAGVSVDERRQMLPRPLPQLDPPPALTVSGFEPWASFRRALDQLHRGDAVLVVDVAASPALAQAWDEVFRVDYRVALGRALATTRRTQDRVSMVPEGLPVMAVVAGHHGAPAAVFDRVRSLWGREVATGTPLCAFGHIGAHRHGADLVEQAVVALLRDPDPDRPLREL